MRQLSGGNKAHEAKYCKHRTFLCGGNFSLFLQLPIYQEKLPPQIKISPCMYCYGNCTAVTKITPMSNVYLIFLMKISPKQNNHIFSKLSQ